MTDLNTPEGETLKLIEKIKGDSKEDPNSAAKLLIEEFKKTNIGNQTNPLKAKEIKENPFISDDYCVKIARKFNSAVGSKPSATKDLQGCVALNFDSKTFTGINSGRKDHFKLVLQNLLKGKEDLNGKTLKFNGIEDLIQENSFADVLKVMINPNTSNKSKQINEMARFLKERAKEFGITEEGLKNIGKDKDLQDQIKLLFCAFVKQKFADDNNEFFKVEYITGGDHIGFFESSDIKLTNIDSLLNEVPGIKVDYGSSKIYAGSTKESNTGQNIPMGYREGDERAKNLIAGTVKRPSAKTQASRTYEYLMTQVAIRNYNRIKYNLFQKEIADISEDIAHYTKEIEKLKLGAGAGTKTEELEALVTNLQTNALRITKIKKQLRYLSQKIFISLNGAMISTISPQQFILAEEISNFLNDETKRYQAIPMTFDTGGGKTDFLDNKLLSIMPKAERVNFSRAMLFLNSDGNSLLETELQKLEDLLKDTKSKNPIIISIDEIDAIEYDILVKRIQELIKNSPFKKKVLLLASSATLASVLVPDGGATDPSTGKTQRQELIDRELATQQKLSDRSKISVQSVEGVLPLEENVNAFLEKIGTAKKGKQDYRAQMIFPDSTYAELNNLITGNSAVKEKLLKLKIKHLLFENPNGKGYQLYNLKASGSEYEVNNYADIDEVKADVKDGDEVIILYGKEKAIGGDLDIFSRSVHNQFIFTTKEYSVAKLKQFIGRNRTDDEYKKFEGGEVICGPTEPDSIEIRTSNIGNNEDLLNGVTNGENGSLGAKTMQFIENFLLNHERVKEEFLINFKKGDGTETTRVELIEQLQAGNLEGTSKNTEYAELQHEDNYNILNNLYNESNRHANERLWFINDKNLSIKLGRNIIRGGEIIEKLKTFTDLSDYHNFELTKHCFDYAHWRNEEIGLINKFKSNYHLITLSANNEKITKDYHDDYIKYRSNKLNSLKERNQALKSLLSKKELFLDAEVVDSEEQELPELTLEEFKNLINQGSPTFGISDQTKIVKEVVATAILSSPVEPIHTKITTVNVTRKQNVLKPTHSVTKRKKIILDLNISKPNTLDERLELLITGLNEVEPAADLEQEDLDTIFKYLHDIDINKDSIIKDSIAKIQTIFDLLNKLPQKSPQKSPQTKKIMDRLQLIINEAAKKQQQQKSILPSIEPQKSPSVLPPIKSPALPSEVPPIVPSALPPEVRPTPPPEVQPEVRPTESIESNELRQELEEQLRGFLTAAITILQSNQTGQLDQEVQKNLDTIVKILRNLTEGNFLNNLSNIDIGATLSLISGSISDDLGLFISKLKELSQKIKKSTNFEAEISNEVIPDFLSAINEFLEKLRLEINNSKQADQPTMSPTESIESNELQQELEGQLKMILEFIENLQNNQIGQLDQELPQQLQGFFEDLKNIQANQLNQQNLKIIFEILKNLAEGNFLNNLSNFDFEQGPVENIEAIVNMLNSFMELLKNRAIADRLNYDPDLVGKLKLQLQAKIDQLTQLGLSKGSNNLQSSQNFSRFQPNQQSQVPYQGPFDDSLPNPFHVFQGSSMGGLGGQSSTKNPYQNLSPQFSNSTSPHSLIESSSWQTNFNDYNLTQRVSALEIDKLSLIEQNLFLQQKYNDLQNMFNASQQSNTQIGLNPYGFPQGNTTNFHQNPQSSINFPGLQTFTEINQQQQIDDLLRRVNGLEIDKISLRKQNLLLQQQQGNFQNRFNSFSNLRGQISGTQGPMSGMQQTYLQSGFYPDSPTINHHNYPPQPQQTTPLNASDINNKLNQTLNSYQILEDKVRSLSAQLGETNSVILDIGQELKRLRQQMLAMQQNGADQQGINQWISGHLDGLEKKMLDMQQQMLGMPQNDFSQRQQIFKNFRDLQNQMLNMQGQMSGMQGQMSGMQHQMQDVRQTYPQYGVTPAMPTLIPGGYNSQPSFSQMYPSGMQYTQTPFSQQKYKINQPLNGLQQNTSAQRSGIKVNLFELLLPSIQDKKAAHFGSVKAGDTSLQLQNTLDASFAINEEIRSKLKGEGKEERETNYLINTSGLVCDKMKDNNINLLSSPANQTSTQTVSLQPTSAKYTSPTSSTKTFLESSRDLIPNILAATFTIDNKPIGLVDFTISLMLEPENIRKDQCTGLIQQLSSQGFQQNEIECFTDLLRQIASLDSQTVEGKFAQTTYKPFADNITLDAYDNLKPRANHRYSSIDTVEIDNVKNAIEQIEKVLTPQGTLPSQEKDQHYQQQLIQSRSAGAEPQMGAYIG